MAIHRMGMIALVFMLASVACAQSAKAAIIKDLEAQVASTKQYCEMVSRYAADHKPIEVAARSENGSQRWYRLPNTPETFPQPILSAPNAKVWVFEGQIVAVSLITEDVSRGFKPAEYCFWPNGKLARLVVEPQAREIKFLPAYWSRRNVGMERVYAPDGRQLLTSTLFSRESPKSEVTSFVYPQSAYFFDVHQLPFFGQVLPEQ